jgi:hypothetical protein
MCGSLSEPRSISVVDRAKWAGAILCKRRGMANGIDYTANEWIESTSHRPLRDVRGEDLLLLHRHYMWANQQREAFFKLLENPSADALTPGPLMMATREMGFMFVWYGLLWSVLEAFKDRSLDIRGPFLEDVKRMTDLLRRCRNAVMHVPAEGQLLDRRIDELVKEPESAVVIRRIHRGVGRLFVEEFKRQTKDSESPSDVAT